MCPVDVYYISYLHFKSESVTASNISNNNRVREKELEKIEKYQNLKIELKRLWSLKKVEIVPAVVGALGCISKGFSRWMDILGIKLCIGMVQKSVLLGTARILRKVLDM